MESRRTPGSKAIGTLTMLAAATLVLAACSSTKLAYRYADWGIVWWVDDYISMTGEQQAQLEQDIVDLRDWHCSTELPRYSAWLTDLRQDIRYGDLDQPRVAHHQQQLLSFFPPLAEQAKPAATRLLSSLSDEQVREFAGSMAESQAELEEEYLSESPEQTRQDRAERTIDRAERWLGALNDAQTQIVTQWSEARGRQTEIWLQGRQNWQQALLEALERRQSENFGQQLGQLIDNNIEVRGARYQQMMAESQASLAGLISDLLQEADQQQLDHLLEEVATLRGEFNTLTCTG